MELFDSREPLIEAIYDAALNADQWSAALAGIASFVGGKIAGMLTKDTTTGCVCAHYHTGVAPDFAKLYVDTYWQFDPSGGIPRFDVDEVVSVPSLVPYEEFRASRFYREWAEPQGIVDFACAVLEKQGTTCSYLLLASSADDGMFDDEARLRLASIVPHVRRAMQIGRVVEGKEAEASTFSDILDGLSAGLFLVSAGGRVAHSNEAGRDILAAGDVMWSVGGRLMASDTAVNQTLREIFAACERGGQGISPKGIALPVASRGGDHYVVHVLPLTSERRNASDATVAAVFVRRATIDAPPSSAIIGRAYKLTPAEMRVLLAIVEVGGVPEVSAALGVADTTIKTHLGRLYEKTGTGRQADLVKLVAGFSTPLAN